MSFIEISNVSKFWGDVKAVENLNINVDEGEFVVLLGPSGCGKSTTLRLIAGLESVTSGEISIAGNNINNLDPSLRNISMVFQSYALFPHLNVEENIVFGLKVRNVKSVERQSRLKKVAEKVGLEEKEEDFGQTLATWGVGNGPYIILPIFGPSNLRDTAGMFITSTTDPTNLYLIDQGEGEWIALRTAGTAIDQRSKIIEEVNTLRENSVDYYAAVRSSYYQNRDAAIKNRDDTQLTPVPVISVEFE